MNADELLTIARRGKPHVRYARNRHGNAIAGFDEKLGRWCAVASLTIHGLWVSMPFELLVNGQPLHRQEDWLE